MNEHQLRKALVTFGRRCYERNLLVAMDGNLSARLPSGDILCTAAGCHKGFLTDDDLVVIDRRGNRLRGLREPTSEIAMHLACYDARDDINAVVHAHPPIAVAFTIAGVSMARCVLPETVLTLGSIPTVVYETTGSTALAARVAQAILEHDAILMDRHGAVCVGESVLEAFCRLEVLEHTALITKTARDLGTISDLPQEEVVRLRSMGLQRYGGPPTVMSRTETERDDVPQVCTDCSGCPSPTGVGVAAPVDLRMARVSAQPLGVLSRGRSDEEALEARVLAEVLKVLTE